MQGIILLSSSFYEFPFVTFPSFAYPVHMGNWGSVGGGVDQEYNYSQKDIALMMYKRRSNQNWRFVMAIVAWLGKEIIITFSRFTALDGFHNKPFSFSSSCSVYRIYGNGQLCGTFNHIVVCLMTCERHDQLKTIQDIESVEGNNLMNSIKSMVKKNMLTSHVLLALSRADMVHFN